MPAARVGAALAAALHEDRAALVEEPQFSRGVGLALDVMAISHLLRPLSRKDHSAAWT